MVCWGPAQNASPTISFISYWEIRSALWIFTLWTVLTFPILFVKQSIAVLKEPGNYKMIQNMSKQFAHIRQLLRERFSSTHVSWLYFFWSDRNENIKLLSQAEYNDERIKTLQNNGEVLKRQIAALEKNNGTLNGEALLYSFLLYLPEAFILLNLAHLVYSQEILR